MTTRAIRSSSPCVNADAAAVFLAVSAARIFACSAGSSFGLRARNLSRSAVCAVLWTQPRFAS